MPEKRLSKKLQSSLRAIRRSNLEYCFSIDCFGLRPRNDVQNFLRQPLYLFKEEKITYSAFTPVITTLMEFLAFKYACTFF